MKSHKRLLIAGLAVAVALLAVGVTTALAAVWKDKGVNVTKLVTLGLTGGEDFEIEGKNGMNCKVAATMTTEGGSTAKITAWKLESCKGFGTYNSCTANVKEAKGLPWTVHVDTTELTITNLRIRRTFTGCAQGELDKTIASSTVALNTPTEIKEMEFDGTNGTYRSFGSFSVEAPNNGTYGIG